VLFAASARNTIEVPACAGMTIWENCGPDPQSKKPSFPRKREPRGNRARRRPVGRGACCDISVEHHRGSRLRGNDHLGELRAGPSIQKAVIPAKAGTSPAVRAASAGGRGAFCDIGTEHHRGSRLRGNDHLGELRAGPSIQKAVIPACGGTTGWRNRGTDPQSKKPSFPRKREPRGNGVRHRPVGRGACCDIGTEHHRGSRLRGNDHLGELRAGPSIQKAVIPAKAGTSTAVCALPAGGRGAFCSIGTEHHRGSRLRGNDHFGGIAG